MNDHQIHHGQILEKIEKLTWRTAHHLHVSFAMRTCQVSLTNFSNQDESTPSLRILTHRGVHVCNKYVTHITHISKYIYIYVCV